MNWCIRDWDVNGRTNVALKKYCSFFRECKKTNPLLHGAMFDYWLPFCFSNFRFTSIPDLALCEERLTNIAPCKSGFVFLHSRKKEQYFLSATFAPTIDIPVPDAPVHTNLGLKRVVGLVPQIWQNSQSSDTVMLVWFDKNYKLSVLYFNIYQWNKDAKCWIHSSECFHYRCSPAMWNIIHSPDSRIVFFNFSETCSVLRYFYSSESNKHCCTLKNHDIHGICRSLPNHSLYYESKRKTTWLMYPETYTGTTFNLLNVLDGSISQEKAKSIHHFRHFPDTVPYFKDRERLDCKKWDYDRVQNWDYDNEGLVLTKCERKHNKKRRHFVRHNTKALLGCERSIVWFDPRYGEESWFGFPLPLLCKQFHHATDLVLGGNRSFILSAGSSWEAWADVTSCCLFFPKN